MKLLLLFLMMFAGLWFFAELVMKMGLISKCRDKTNRFYWALLFLCTTLVVLFVYRKFIFGDIVYAFNDIGSDTTQQYIPLYLDLIHDFQRGNVSVWNQNYGLGCSRLVYQSLYFDPFNLILIPSCVYLGDWFLPYALISIQIAKVYIASIGFYIFLSFYGFKEPAKIVSSLVYSINGYLVLWGNHYFLGNACLFVLLILVGIELYFDNRSRLGRLLLSAGVALVTLLSVYISFMTLVPCAIYALLRGVYLNESWSKGFKSFSDFILPVVGGLLVSAVVSVPVAYLLLFDSSRISGGPSLQSKVLTALSSNVGLGDLRLFLLRVMGNNYAGTWSSDFGSSNYYELPQIGCSGVIYSFIFLYLVWLLSSKRSRTRNIVLGIALVLPCLYLINTFFPAFLNVFSEVKYRSSFFIPFCCCLVIAVVFDQLQSAHFYSKPSILVALLISLVISVLCCIGNEGDAKALSLFLMLVCIALIACLLLSVKSLVRFVFILSISAVSLSMADAYVSVTCRTHLKKDSFPTYQLVESGISANALNYVMDNDSSVYRMDKTFSEWSVFQDGLIQNYDGVTSYNSTRPKEEISLLDAFWQGNTDGTPSHVYSAFFFDQNEGDAAGLFGVKYVLSGDELSYDWLDLVEVIDHIYIYKNRHYSFGTFYSNVRKENDCINENHNSLWDCLNSGEAIVDDDSYAKLDRTLNNDHDSKVSSVNVTEVDEGRYDVSVSSDNDGLVMVPVLSSPGWRAFVDGSEAECITVNYGFISTAVSKGEHHVEFVYIPYGLMLGIFLSLLGLFIVCVVVATPFRRG